VIRHAGYGVWIMGMRCRCWKDMKMKYLPALLIMKEILLLVEVRIILVGYGKIRML
jgi:hypothetical protein